MTPPRLRMFARPNGSGKTSLIRLLREEHFLHHAADRHPPGDAGASQGAEQGAEPVQCDRFTQSGSVSNPIAESKNVSGFTVYATPNASLGEAAADRNSRTGPTLTRPGDRLQSQPRREPCPAHNSAVAQW